MSRLTPPRVDSPPSELLEKPVGPRRQGGGAGYAAAVAVTRVVAGVLIAHFTLSVFSTGRSYTKGDRWISGFNQWDSGWVLGIARYGYVTPQHTVFFPGYPLLVRAVWAVTLHRLSIEVCGVVVAWCCFVAAVVITNLLFRRMLGQEATGLATILFAWSPASIFFLAAYPEGMFLALAGAALYLTREHRYVLAALVSGLATSCTPLAVGVPCAVGVGLILAVRSREIHPIRAVATAFLAVWGLLAWMIYLAVRFGDPVLFAKEQHTFNRSTGIPFISSLSAVAHLGTGAKAVGFSQGNWFDTRLINLCFMFVGLLLFLYFTASLLRPNMRRFPLTFCAYAAVTALVPGLSVQRLGGIPNPEAGLRLTCDNLGLYGTVASFAGRRTEWALPLVCLWAALAVFVQSVFTNGFYFT